MADEKNQNWNADQQRNQQQDQMNESVDTDQNMGNKTGSQQNQRGSSDDKATPALPARVSKRNEAVITQRKVFSGRGL